MDQAIQQFLQTGTLVLAFSVFIITFFIRRIVETAIPSLVKKADENEMRITYSTTFARWWNQLFLYMIPVAIGALIGIANIPFLFGPDIKTMTGRCFFGGVVGWFSSTLYKIFQRVLEAKVGITPPSISEPPAAEPPK